MIISITALLIVGTTCIVKYYLRAEEFKAMQRWDDQVLEPKERQLLRDAGYPV